MQIFKLANLTRSNLWEVSSSLYYRVGRKNSIKVFADDPDFVYAMNTCGRQLFFNEESPNIC